MIPYVREIKFDYGKADQVSPLIRRVVANNPGPFTYLGTGTYIIGRGEVAVIDPGPDMDEHLEAILGALEPGEKITHILITHHHADHTGGVAALREATGARVIGPAHEPMPEPLQRVGAGEHVDVLGLRFEVIEVPGHTAGHIAFYAAEADGTPLLFCGDTLFSGGCGRLFEGTPAQMLDSLTRLAALPADTRVCCTHEYTLSNLKFAQAIEPDNSDLTVYTRHCQAQRALNFP
ncbi:MAG TPA: hydroxyacylglutathione hydrolase, partial [Phenylobacterium sp.]|nr:hydroxyacylglutathione hydrolase [Phenylobacterium sp.]